MIRFVKDMNKDASLWVDPSESASVREGDIVRRYTVGDQGDENIRRYLVRQSERVYPGTGELLKGYIRALVEEI